MTGFLSGKTSRKSSHSPSPAFAAAFEHATHFVPTSEFLTAPDVLDDSAVSLICAVFGLPVHSWYQSILPPTELLRSTLSLPEVDGSLSALFTTIAPMVPAENTALPEIGDVGWHLLRPGHPDSVAGQLRQSLVIGFVLALAVKGLTDPDCLVLPAPVAMGLEVRLPAPSTSARLGARVESLESSLASLQSAVASAEVTSAARSDAMEARLLADLSALLASQHQSHPSVQPDPVMPPPAGTPYPAHPPDVLSSGRADSDSNDEFSDHDDSLATADTKAAVPVSPLSGSPSYYAMVYRIRQESGYEGTVAYALVTEGVLLSTIVGGIFSARFRFTSNSNQSKARSLLFAELFKGQHSPANSSATMMSAPRDC